MNIIMAILKKLVLLGVLTICTFFFLILTERSAQAYTGQPIIIISVPPQPSGIPVVRAPPDVAIDSIENIMPQPRPTPAPIVCGVEQPGCPNVISGGIQPPAPPSNLRPTPPQTNSVPIRIIRIAP
jgi:hypothetical protein